MDRVFSLLAEIRKCPQMYLGKLSLERLSFFINGFMFRDFKDNEKNLPEGNCLDGFQAYIQKKYQLNSTHHWSSIIQFFSLTDEDAFNEFYRLLDEFLAKKNRRRKSKIECVSYDDFIRLTKRDEDRQYQAKWFLINEIIKQIQAIKPEKILEIQPSLFMLVNDADILFEHTAEACRIETAVSTKVIAHDISVFPWPIEDKNYDLVICLQAFERLTGKQAEVFREIKRISKHAILSFPRQRYCPLDYEICPTYPSVDEAGIVRDWMGDITPTMSISVDGAEDMGNRYVHFWKFQS